MDKETLLRFWSKVNLNHPSGCWIWTACITETTGYGAFKLGTKRVDVHRLSYSLLKGEIPTGLFICHTCDNKRCVNPDHLFAGTHQDNMDDRVKKGKSKRNPIGKEKAAEIKYRIQTRGKRSIQHIADLVGVAYIVVLRIKNGEAYKNVEPKKPAW